MTIIDTRYTEGKSLIEYLINNKEVSFVSEAENNFKKTLLLCTASYFEHQITSIIKEFAKFHSQANPMIMSYIEIQGINRKYHTLFNWDSGNINQFLGNFGAAFKESFNAKIKSEKELEIGVKSFIELGSDRNSLVHQNFAAFSVQKTADEIYSKYKEANIFVETLKAELIK